SQAAHAELLPQAAAEGAKLGFRVPFGHWLRGGMYGFAEQAVRSAQTGQWLNKGAALDVLRRFRSEDPEVTWRQVWLLVVFSLWHQIYVERVYDPVALGWETPAAGRGPNGTGIRLRRRTAPAAARRTRRPSAAPGSSAGRGAAATSRCRPACP